MYQNLLKIMKLDYDVCVGGMATFHIAYCNLSLWQEQQEVENILQVQFTLFLCISVSISFHILMYPI